MKLGINSSLTRLLCLAVTMCSNVIQAQDGGEVAWQVKIPGIGIAHGRSVVTAHDEGFVVAGWTATTDLLEVQAYLLKLDDNGEKVWERTLARDHDAWSVCKCSDSTYVVAGSTSFFASASESDFYITKRGIDGQLIWQHSYGGENQDFGRAVQQTSDGGFILVGWTAIEPNSEAYMLKTDQDGNAVWERRYKGSAGESAQASVVTELDKNNYLIGGSLKRDTFALPSRYLLRTSPEGGTVWETSLGSRAGTVNWVQHADGRTLAAWTVFTAFEESSTFIGEINDDGSVLWETEFVDSIKGEDSFIVLKNGQVVVAGGYAQDNPQRTCAFQIAGSDHYGQRLWDGSFVPIGPVECEIALMQIEDGGFVMVGGNDNKLYAVRFFPAPANPLIFIRGDSDGSGSQEITDAIVTLRRLVGQDEESTCPDAEDSNDDGRVDLTDAVYLLEYLFRGGVGLAIPSDLGLCGLDPTDDEIYCQGQPACMSDT